MADYSVRHIKNDEYKTSAWSGGMTTEIGIGPDGACYADRDFLWRISSATVDLEESTFTALPDYDRIIMTLEGDIDLWHDQGEQIRLKAFETHAFDGGAETLSRGKAVDFNLMLRKGQAEGTVIPLRSGGEKSGKDEPFGMDDAGRYSTILIYCYKGNACVHISDSCSVELKSGESLRVDGNLSGIRPEVTGDSDLQAVIAAVRECRP